MNYLFEKRAREILEALYVDPESDKLIFDYKGRDGLSIHYGKGKGVQFEPFESNSKDFGGSRVISLFSTSSIKGSDREQIVTPIMKALKGQSTTEVDDAEFKKWLKQAALVMGRYLQREIKPDAILAVKSSSQLNNLFVKELAAHIPGAAIIPDAIGKADIRNITISDRATDIQRKAAERELKKAQQAGVLSFKKIHVSLRPLFQGVMKVEEVAKNLEGRTVVVLDDIMTTRATQMHALDVVRQYNPREIVGVTLFKQ